MAYHMPTVSEQEGSVCCANLRPTADLRIKADSFTFDFSCCLSQSRRGCKACKKQSDDGVGSHATSWVCSGGEAEVDARRL